MLRCAEAAVQLPPGYLLENVWEDKGPELEREIVDFWLASGALRQRERAEERVDQVLFVVRYGEGQIVAVSTVYRRFNRQLNNTFYYFRCFVAAEHRQYNLGVVLLLEARDFLSERFRRKVDAEAIGVFLEIENERLKTIRNQAVWPISGFVFVGKNPRGDHLRVYYFPGARIR